MVGPLSNNHCYIITFELFNETEYDKIFNAIKDFGYWGRISKYTFAVVTDFTVQEIMTYMFNYIDKNSKVFVIRSSNIAGWLNADCGSDWLKKYLAL